MKLEARNTLVAASALLAGSLAAQDEFSLRIVEVDPAENTVVIQNSASSPITVGTNVWVCIRPAYREIPGLEANVTLNPGQLITLDLDELSSPLDLNDSISDLWLYSGSAFGDSNSVIHGLAYGASVPSPNRLTEATNGGKWDSVTSVVAPPASGETVVYSGSGFSPASWTAQPAQAPLDEFSLRLAGIYPGGGNIEVYNPTSTPVVLANNLWVCSNRNYVALPTLTAGTRVEPGEVIVVNLSSLTGSQGVYDLTAAPRDLWLYSTNGFSNGNNIIHGAVYGEGDPSPNRLTEATTAGRWEALEARLPAPGAGEILSYDNTGFESGDWYLDGTPSIGLIDPITPGSTIVSGLSWPGGTQDFEDASLEVGDLTILAIPDWPFVGDLADVDEYSVRIAEDVLGDRAERAPGSSRWIRIRDTFDDPNFGNNRLYTNAIDSGAVADEYTWRFWHNLEVPPAPGAANNPLITVQLALNGGGWTNAFGLEFTDTAVNLEVFSDGGIAASTQAWAYNPGATGVGDWVDIELTVDNTNGEVSVTWNGNGPATLPIAPADITDEARFRLCFRGPGEGNTSQYLVDDLSISSGLTAVDHWAIY